MTAWTGQASGFPGRGSWRAGPLGNSLARSLAGREVAAFDALGAPFWYPLDGFVAAAARPALADRLRAPMTADGGGAAALRPAIAGLAESAEGLRVGVMPQTAPGGGGHLSLAGRAATVAVRGGNGLGVAAFSTDGMAGRSPVGGAILSWQPASSPIEAHGGWLGERETLVGSRASGAFGQVGANSFFVGVGGDAAAGGWRLAASAEMGVALPSAQGGILTGVSPLMSSAAAVRVERVLGGGGVLRLSASQPLRVEQGKARLSVPAGRTQDGTVLRRRASASLVPAGRQIDLSAQWLHASPGVGELRLGGTWTQHPGHNAGAAPEISLLAGWRYTF